MSKEHLLFRFFDILIALFWLKMIRLATAAIVLDRMCSSKLASLLNMMGWCMVWTSEKKGRLEHRFLV